MAHDKRKSITEKQWQAAVDSYELGTKHARQIAHELGVSPSTVSREFKRRGCVKACRVEESIAPLVAALNAKDRRLATKRRAEGAAAAKRCAEIDRLMREMMKSVIAAAKAGDLAAAGPTIERVGKSLG